MPTLKRAAVINVVGLSQGLLGPHTPRLAQYARRHPQVRILPAFPAVTCTAQATYLTGRPPADHGIVGNGWFQRDLAEIHFWKQSGHLVQQPRLWDDLRARVPGFTCAQLFWWFNMYSGADYAITPRPMYPADGRKVFDIYTTPSSIRAETKTNLGEFPFPGFWGPAAGVDGPQGPADAASRWIAESAKWVEDRYRPTLSLVYLPHLDYNLQRHGLQFPKITRDLGHIDAIAGDLIEFYERREIQVVVLSEYALTSVHRPIHLNRLFRDCGWIALREELGRELLDPGASRVFAVADHQVAHLYLNDPQLETPVRRVLAQTPGVAEVLGAEEKAARRLDHPRAGNLIAVAAPDSWFTYYYWRDTEPERAPDFARTVDIHRKPGYDPVELFLDPTLPFPRAKILWRLLQKRLGFRMLMDVIPLDASLVRGSHGSPPATPGDHPILIAPASCLGDADDLEATEVYWVLRRLLL